VQPADKVIQLNKWIKEYADKNGLTYVDYHSAMKDGARKEFSAAAVYTSETFTCVQQDKAIQQDKANKNGSRSMRIRMV